MGCFFGLANVTSNLKFQLHAQYDLIQPIEGSNQMVAPLRSTHHPHAIMMHALIQLMACFF